MTEMLRPRIKEQGLVNMLTVPAETTQKTESQDAPTEKGDDDSKKLRGDGGAQAPA